MGSFPLLGADLHLRADQETGEEKLITGDFLVDLLNLEEESLPLNQGIGTG